MIKKLKINNNIIQLKFNIKNNNNNKYKIKII